MYTPPNATTERMKKTTKTTSGTRSFLVQVVLPSARFPSKVVLPSEVLQERIW